MVPLYLDAPEKWARLMRTTLAFNGSYVSTNRMVEQYNRNVCYPVPAAGARPGGRAGIRGLKDRATRVSILGSGIGLPLGIHLPFTRGMTCLTSH